MRNFIKKYAGILYIVLAGAVVLAVVLNSHELPLAIKAFGALKKGWLWMCAAAMAMYVTLRAVTLKYYLRREGVTLRFPQALMVTGVGQFYSAITPSSSGGQPMQVLSMHRLGVPVSTATAAVSVKFVGFQCAFLLIGLVMWIGYWPMVAAQLGGVRYLVALGYVINLALMAAVALTMVKSHWVNRAVEWCLRMAARLRLVKHEQEAREKAFVMLEDYRGALKRLIEHPTDALVVLILSCAQIVCLMSVPQCLYHAFGLSGWRDAQLFTLQVLLFITAAFVPLPGAAGAQEGGFYLFFKGIFPEGEVLAAMLCWRFFTYYLLVVFGLGAVVAEVVRGWAVRRREKHERA